MPTSDKPITPPTAGSGDPSRSLADLLPKTEAGQPVTRAEVKPAKLLAALDRLEFTPLDERRQLDLLRAYELVFIRLGEPDAVASARIAAKRPHLTVRHCGVPVDKASDSRTPS